MLSLVFLWLTAATAEKPYCALRYKRLCQGKGHHVACLYPDPGPSSYCVNYTAIEFNNDMKNFILHFVNRRRQRIASGNERVRGGVLLPKPKLMMLVGWDRELAFLAQRLADQCNFVHDDCRATVRYPYAGQAVGEVRWGAGGDGDARRAARRVLDAWWGERRRATTHQLTTPFRLPARGAVWGHFSQLCVWNLQAMGCGGVQHGSPPRVLLVCDFSHTNMLGERTLTPGQPAPCPGHTMRRPSSQYSLLCAPVRKPVTKDPEDEYDEDYDPGMEVEVSMSTVKHFRSTWRHDHTEMWTETSEMVFREDSEAKSKGLENRKLKARYKAVHKSRLSEHQIMEWRKRPHAGNWKQNEDMEGVIPLSQGTAKHGDYSAAQHQYRSTDVITPPISYTRHRWKQTRDRPMRPGANALLFTESIKYSTRQTVVPLMLDNEDLDQLFRDTGFKMIRIKQ